jgi:hypothetical protein
VPAITGGNIPSFQRPLARNIYSDAVLFLEDMANYLTAMDLTA